MSEIGDLWRPYFTHHCFNYRQSENKSIEDELRKENKRLHQNVYLNISYNNINGLPFLMFFQIHKYIACYLVNEMFHRETMFYISWVLLLEEWIFSYDGSGAFNYEYCRVSFRSWATHFHVEICSF